MGSFGLELGKGSVIFEINNLSNCKVLSKKSFLKSRPKMAFLGVLGGNFKKNVVIFQNQPPQICVIVKFGSKMRILKFGTRNLEFGPDLDIF